MGMINSKDGSRRIDEATSNSDLSKLRYVITEKPKWKVFKKREVVPIPAYQASVRPVKGCPCGANGPCKQKVTPKGVTIHYPQKKFHENAVLFLKDPSRAAHDVITSGRGIVKATRKTFSSLNAKKPASKSDPGYYASPRSKVKTIKSKKFPTWRLDKISYRPNFGQKIIRPRPYES